MKERDRDKGDGCPLLRPAGYAGSGRPPVPVYCRLPSGKVRVPTPAELGSLCFVERYRDCSGYRRWAKSRRGLAASRA